MLELDGSIWFRSGAQNWGGKNRIDLLAQIDATGSITAAAVSYTHLDVYKRQHWA